MQNSSVKNIESRLKELTEYAAQHRLSVPGGTLVKWRELIETGEDYRKIRLFIYQCGRRVKGAQKTEMIDDVLRGIGSGTAESDEILIDPEEYPDLSGTYKRSTL